MSEPEDNDPRLSFFNLVFLRFETPPPPPLDELLPELESSLLELESVELVELTDVEEELLTP